MTVAIPLDVVRVVDRLGNPEAPFVVPGQADWLGDLGLAGEQAGFEAVGNGHVLDRLGGGDGELHRLDRSRPSRCPRPAPNKYWGMSDGAFSVGSGLSPAATLGRLSKTPPLFAAQRRPRSIRAWKPGLPQVRWSWP